MGAGLVLMTLKVSGIVGVGSGVGYQTFKLKPVPVLPCLVLVNVWPQSLAPLLHGTAVGYYHCAGCGDAGKLFDFSLRQQPKNLPHHGGATCSLCE